MKRVLVPVILLLSVVSAVAAAFLWQKIPGDSTGKAQENLVACSDCNVLLISIDTLRADHLGCYGYPLPTTPAVDAFSKEALLFRNAIAHAPTTATSHASIFTSLIPVSHGAFGSRGWGITKKMPTLAELLKGKGFATASFNGGGQLHGPSGFARGFDIYQSFKRVKLARDRFRDRVQEGIEWIDQNRARQFFLFLHSYEVHTPYDPDDQYRAMFDTGYQGDFPRRLRSSFLGKRQAGGRRLSEEERNHVVSLYDAGIRSMDDGFARLIDYLKRSGLYDKTLILFLSDHGEELGEHGLVGFHLRTLYDELLKVPLIVKFPYQQFAGQEISTQVRGIDVVPTVLQTLGLPALPHAQGVSLLSAFQEDQFPKHAISQRDSPAKNIPTSVRTNQWKATRRGLYDLVRDPLEQKNIASEQPAQHQEFLEIIRALPTLETSEDNSVVIDAETLEQLKTLGYL